MSTVMRYLNGVHVMHLEPTSPIGTSTQKDTSPAPELIKPLSGARTKTAELGETEPDAGILKLLCKQLKAEVQGKRALMLRNKDLERQLQGAKDDRAMRDRSITELCNNVEDLEHTVQDQKLRYDALQAKMDSTMQDAELMKVESDELKTSLWMTAAKEHVKLKSLLADAYDIREDDSELAKEADEDMDRNDHLSQLTVNQVDKANSQLKARIRAIVPNHGAHHHFWNKYARFLSQVDSVSKQFWTYLECLHIDQMSYLSGTYVSHEDMDWNDQAREFLTQYMRDVKQTPAPPSSTDKLKPIPYVRAP